MKTDDGKLGTLLISTGNIEWRDKAMPTGYLKHYAPRVRLALWPRQNISHETGLPVSPSSPTEMTLGHNVSSKAEVDAVMSKALAAGARIVKGAHDTFWGGYSGYFQDPDDHLWEIVWNPQWLE